MPRGPYSLALSARTMGDATRRFRDGVLGATLEVDGRLERAQAWQAPDGRLVLRTESEGGLELLCFVLAADDDHSEFLLRFRDDPLLGRTVRVARGLRPLRLATVAHALLRALCEQLIETKRARAIERRIVRAATQGLDGFHASPTGESLARFSTAELRALGLHARRAATLVRLCRSLDLERLRDLGLIKLLSAMRGRWVEGWETAELLEPYGEWAGLASVYMLAGYGRGLVPLRSAA